MSGTNPKMTPYGMSNSSAYSRHNAEEESKQTRGRVEASFQVRQAPRQQTSTFGDFTGNVKTFTKPEEDQKSSRAHLDREEEIKDYDQPDFNRGKSD